MEDNHKSVGDPEISDKSNGVEQVKEASLQVWSSSTGKFYSWKVYQESYIGYLHTIMYIRLM